MDIIVTENISDLEIFVLEDEMSAVFDTACTRKLQETFRILAKD